MKKSIFVIGVFFLFTQVSFAQTAMKNQSQETVFTVYKPKASSKTATPKPASQETVFSVYQPPVSKPSLVDYDAFEILVKEVKAHRANHLVTLDMFLKLAAGKNTVILDARSEAMYELKHVKGAVHLDFSDFTQENLDRIMNRYAGKDTRILIYCNNNFEDNTKPDLQDIAFVTKSSRPQTFKAADANLKPITLALNIPTYLNLYGYGYKNVYELSELIDVNDPRIKFTKK